MSFDPLSAVLEIGKSAIDKIWPDPLKRAEQVHKLEELHQAGDLAALNAEVKIIEGQLGVNAKEAGHKSVFVAGWRPAIGWVGATALAYQFVIYPTLLWFWAICEVMEWVPKGVQAPPAFESGELYTIVTGMLGIGGLRSLDKRGGVQTDSISSGKAK